MAYVYIVKCLDGSLYTGICLSLEKRMKQHQEGKGAKYTRSRGVSEIQAAWKCDEYNDARKLEYAIKKKLDRKEKMRLISGELCLSWVLKDGLESSFSRVEREDFPKIECEKQ